MSGAALSIRRAVPADSGAFTRLMADPSVFGGTMQMPYPTEERWRTMLTEQSQPGRTDLHLVAERDGQVVGSAGLMPTGPSIRRRHAMMLGISVAGEAQGSGIGTALMAALCDYADRWIGLLRIELTLHADNEVAERLYRRFVSRSKVGSRAIHFETARMSMRSRWPASTRTRRRRPGPADRQTLTATPGRIPSRCPPPGRCRRPHSCSCRST